MKEISFFAQGIPKGQPRPRAFAMKGHVRVYDPGTAEGWKSCIAEAARPFVSERIASPVSVSCTFVLPRPKCHYRSGKNSHELKADAPCFHTGKPDIDNFEKAVFDALVVIGLLADDAFIVESHASKIYATDQTKTGAYITLRPALVIDAVAA